MNKKFLNPDSVYFSNSAYQLAEHVEEEGGSQVKLREDIPIFREGKFKHPYYGDLDFDRQYLQKIVDNFNASVNPQQVAFDRDHMPYEGALAWVKNEPGSLYIKDEVVELGNGRKEKKAFLYAKIQYTSLGEELVGGEVFKYFSSEIHPNYSTRELVATNGGGPDNEEAIYEYGPTLIGGGFTNRPFIPALGGVYNEDGEGSEDPVDVYSSKGDDGAMYFAVVKEEQKSTQEQEEPQNVPEEQEVEEEPEQGEDLTEEQEEFNDTDKTKGEKMKFSELMEGAKAFATPEEKINYLEQNVSNVDDDVKPAVQALLEAEEAKVDATKQAQEAVAQYNRVNEKLETEKKRNRDLQVEMLKVKEQSFSAKVKEFTANLKAEGHIDSVVEKVNDILLSIKPDSRDMKFNAFSEDEEEVSYGLLDILEQVFAAMPEDAKLNLSANLGDEQEVAPEASEVDASEDDEEPTKLSDEDKLVAKFHENYPNYNFSDEEILKVVSEDGKIDMKKVGELTQ